LRFLKYNSIFSQLQIPDNQFLRIAYFCSEGNIIKVQQLIQISTPAHNGLYDITRQVEDIVRESGITTGMVNVYAQGAAAAIMILVI
jgi:hypothetical protein